MIFAMKLFFENLDRHGVGRVFGQLDSGFLEELRPTFGHTEWCPLGHVLLDTEKGIGQGSCRGKKCGGRGIVVVVIVVVVGRNAWLFVILL